MFRTERVSSAGLAIQTIEDQVLYAIKRNDINLFKKNLDKLIAIKKDINQPYTINNLNETRIVNRDRRNFLHFAVESCCPEIVNYLIKKGADVNRVDSKGNTVFHLIELKEYTWNHNFREMVKILYNCEFNPDIKNLNGNTIFHLQINNNNFDNAYRLLNKYDNFDLDIKNNDGLSCFNLMSQEENFAFYNGLKNKFYADLRSQVNQCADLINKINQSQKKNLRSFKMWPRTMGKEKISKVPFLEYMAYKVLIKKNNDEKLFVPLFALKRNLIKIGAETDLEYVDNIYDDKLKSSQESLVYPEEREKEDLIETLQDFQKEQELKNNKDLVNFEMISLN